MSKAFDLVDHGLYLSETYHVLLHIFCCSGIVVNSHRLISFLHLFLYQMVYDRMESYLQSCLRFILMSFCSICKILVWNVIGKGCLLDVTLMTLPYLLLLLVHSGKCFRSALIRCGRLLQSAKLSPSVLCISWCCFISLVFSKVQPPFGFRHVRS